MSSRSSHQAVLPPARDYVLRLGWSVIPAVEKKCRGKWKQYQRERPDELTLCQWFGDADNGNVGLAVVCGRVSGGLLVRDFDRRESYFDWRRDHPALARTLPTVQTQRGFHVYGRNDAYPLSPQGTFIRKFNDGELRGDGHYVVAPPSLHPRNKQPYRWLIKPQAPLPIVELEVFGITLRSGAVTQEVSVLHAPAPPCFSATANGSLEEQVKAAIAATLPETYGQRHRRLFEFARYLRGIDPLADASPADLEPLVRQWHQAALPHIRTKEFGATFNDFQRGWPRVRIAAGVGDGSIELALARAQANPQPLPPEAADLVIPEFRLLVALCRELQRQRGFRPFYLASRDAADALGLTGNRPHVRAWRWLATLCHRGILRKERSGSIKPPRANEYRYLPPLTDLLSVVTPSGDAQ